MDEKQLVFHVQPFVVYKDCVAKLVDFNRCKYLATNKAINLFIVIAERDLCYLQFERVYQISDHFYMPPFFRDTSMILL